MPVIARYDYVICPNGSSSYQDNPYLGVAVICNSLSALRSINMVESMELNYTLIPLIMNVSNAIGQL